MNIDWKRIKNGYKGFEQLAVDFVKEKEKRINGSWKPTKKTRDNNHDALLATGTRSKKDDNIAIFVGYSDDIDVWWMEAKYSVIEPDNEKKLTRYRLDATIVTAILSENISKIIFITNLNVSSKTICDVRNALIFSGNCSEVIFYTQKHIESWLLNQKFKEFKKYFLYSFYEYKSLSLPSYNSIEEMTIYNIGDNLFQEPLTMIYSGFTYEIFFSISIHEECYAILQKSINIECLLPQMKKIHLFPGTNAFSFKIRLPKQLQREPILPKDVNGEYKAILPLNLTYKIETPISEKIGEVEVIPQTALRLIDSKDFLVNIVSQNKVCQNLLKYTLKSIENASRNCTLISLWGKSGVGKSFILQQYKKELLSKKNFLCLSYTFCNNIVEDMSLLKKLIFNIFFPYICYFDLDKEYIDRLQLDNRRLPKQFWDFVSPKQELDDFLKLCKNTEFLASVLPVHLSINQRILILDDLHKLNDVVYSALMYLAKQFVQYNYNIFCIMASQSELNMKQFRINKKQYLDSIQLSITPQDIQQVLRERIKCIDLVETSVLFGNVIEVVYFIKYLSELDDEIKNYDDFRLAYNLFKRSNILKNEIISKFRNAFNQHPRIESLCSAIYYTTPGIHMNNIFCSEILQNDIEILLMDELIKKDENDYFTVWHDYYREIYLEDFPLKDCEELALPIKSIYDIKNQFILKKHEHYFVKRTLKVLEKLYSKQNFYSIYYILEDAFSTPEARIYYKNCISSEDYYLLFGYFCYANTNASSQYSGYSMFSILYKESQNNSNPIIQCINYIILWELINSMYESGNYDTVQNMILLFNNIPRKLKENWVFLFEWDYFSLKNAVKSVEYLIASEKGKNCLDNVSDVERLADKDVAFSSYRLILSNLTNDFVLSCKLLRDYNKLIRNSMEYDFKTKYMYDFTVKFLDCIENNIDVSEVITANELLKNEFYNDYNRHIYAISILALLKKGIDLCEFYSMEYMKTIRPMKKRQQAFQEAFLAIICLYKNQKKEALNHLRQEKEYFSEYDTYLPIVVNNINFIRIKEFSISDIVFYTGGNISKEKYYVDIRMLY